MHEKNATNSPAAQTVCHFSHNADFYRLRISKYPANAHKMNYFSALCTGNEKKMYVLKFCVCTQNCCGVLRWGGNVLTIMGFQSIMMAGELGGNTG